MGLDMYLDGIKFHSTFGKDENGNTIRVERPKCKDGHDIKRSVLDLGYWRKHPNLHGYIIENYADGRDECQEIELSANALDDIADAIKKDKLPHTEDSFLVSLNGMRKTKKRMQKSFAKLVNG